jgi:hypothetical protein
MILPSVMRIDSLVFSKFKLVNTRLQRSRVTEYGILNKKEKSCGTEKTKLIFSMNEK